MKKRIERRQARTHELVDMRRALADVELLTDADTEGAVKVRRRASRCNFDNSKVEHGDPPQTHDCNFSLMGICQSKKRSTSFQISTKVFLTAAELKSKRNLKGIVSYAPSC